MLSEKMEQLAGKDIPSLQTLWETYANNPNKLRKEAKRIRGMKGFGKPEKFYEGVEAEETFEKDFLPIEKATDLTPAALIVVLDLYFHLTPITMAEETSRSERSGTTVGHNRPPSGGNYGRISVLRPLSEPRRPYDFAPFAALSEHLG